MEEAVEVEEVVMEAEVAAKGAAPHRRVVHHEQLRLHLERHAPRRELVRVRHPILAVADERLIVGRRVP